MSSDVKITSKLKGGMAKGYLNKLAWDNGVQKELTKKMRDLRNSYNIDLVSNDNNYNMRDTRPWLRGRTNYRGNVRKSTSGTKSRVRTNIPSIRFTKRNGPMLGPRYFMTYFGDPKNGVSPQHASPSDFLMRALKSAGFKKYR